VERNAFLSRVARATLTADLPESPRPSPDLPDLGPADMVAMFRSQAQAAHAVVHGPVTRHGAVRVVSSIAAGHDATRFIAWDDLPVPGVPSALLASGMVRVDHEVPPGPRDNLPYADVEVGVTGSDGALAESGSLILVHGPGRARMASLVPEIHIALLDVASIARSLAHWARENPDLVAETTNLVLVTGPSRTADIEQQLNLGVHGPRHVHIVMIR